MNDQHRIETAADNCEVLRARLAKYEDAEGRPVVTGERLQSVEELRAAAYGHPLGFRLAAMSEAADALESQAREIERLEADLESANDWDISQLKVIHALNEELAALKAQPSGVVQWPDADEIMQMAFEEGQPSEDASGYYFELEEFDLFIQRLMGEVARLNSSPVSAGEYGDAYQGAREDLAIWKRRALEAETKVREQDRIIDHLTLEAQGETRFGEPAVSAGEPVYQFQCREIGEGDWGPCDHSRYMYCQKSPEMDTRVVQVQAISAPSHGEQVRDNRAEFKREERYMVVKLSKLADDLGGDELSREEQIYRLAHFGKALVECVVVESDWPEYEPTWAAIKARVTGSASNKQLPGGWAAKPTDDGEGFIISSPRINGVASHFSVFPDSKDYASRALWKMLAAAPSAGSQGGDV